LAAMRDGRLGGTWCQRWAPYPTTSTPARARPATMKLTCCRFWATLRGNSAATVADRNVPSNWGVACLFLVESLVAPPLAEPFGALIDRLTRSLPTWGAGILIRNVRYPRMT